jgi:rRNA maturation protein Rpf1
MENMHQEIDIKLNVIFLQKQIRDTNSQLNLEIQRSLNREFSETEHCMIVTEILSSMTNVHLRITASVNASLDSHGIISVIKMIVKERLKMGVSKIEVLSLREEAEIYGNV